MAEAPEAAQLFSVVVVGAMNPRIHHPHWYRMIGAISEAELQEALDPARADSPVAVPVFAQLKVPSASLVIVCQPNRWEVQTDSEAGRRRAMDLATLVFEKLHETPVTAFGFNTVCDLPTALPVVRSGLARLLVGLNLGLPGGDSISSSITYAAAQGGFAITIDLRPSPNTESNVLLSYNSDYRPPTDQPYFNLGDLLKARVEDHHARAAQWAASAVAGLNRRNEEFNAAD